MSSEIEALGELATGALIARAIEPQGSPTAAATGACKNCATPLSGQFCHQCGQRGHVHRSVLHMAEEFIHGIVHFDTKAWRTLPLLAVQPGRLTRDYVHGHRARYISPLALFLFTIFVMFFAFGFMHPGDDVELNLNSAPATREQALRKITQAQADLTDARTELANEQTELTALEKDPDAAPGAAGAQIGAIAAAKGALVVTEKTLARAQADLKTISNAKPTAAVQAPKKSWQDGVRKFSVSSDININGDKSLEKKARAALQNPDLVLYKIQQKAYKLSFLLIPMSLPFVWMLFFWKRDVKMYDHIVFLLYSLSFMSLLFVLVSLVALALGTLPGWVGVAVILIIFAHMFVQLKGAYQLSIGSALWRTATLGISGFFVLVTFVTLIAIMGLLG